MHLEKKDIYTRRHLAEFLTLGIFSFFVLNPFDIHVGSLYSGATPEAIRESILGLGGLATLGMVILEAFQVVLAPIPPVTMVASGFTFGVFFGSA